MGKWVFILFEYFIVRFEPSMYTAALQELISVRQNKIKELKNIKNCGYTSSELLAAEMIKRKLKIMVEKK